jgi:RNA exonuclease 4
MQYPHQPPLPPGPGPPLPKTTHNIAHSTHVAPMCRFFLSPKGCIKGQLCPFRHEGQPIARHPPPVAPTGAKKPCRFFLHGQCTQGDHCRFSHDTDHLPDVEGLSISSDSKTDSGQKHVQVEDKILTRDLKGPFFAIDVECVATGKGFM